MKKLFYFMLIASVITLVGSQAIKAASPQDTANQFSAGSNADGMTLDADGNLLPNADDVNDLGSSTYSWSEAYIDGTATIGVASITGTATAALVDATKVMTDILNLTKTDLNISSSTKITTLGSSFYRIQSSATAGVAVYMNQSGTDSCIQTTGRTAGDIVILYSSATNRIPVRIINSTTTQKIALHCVSSVAFIEIGKNEMLGLIYDGALWQRMFFNGEQATVK
jgi:hypothetical protein